jgi:hypothetical protein
LGFADIDESRIDDRVERDVQARVVGVGASFGEL